MRDNRTFKSTMNHTAHEFTEPTITKRRNNSTFRSNDVYEMKDMLKRDNETSRTRNNDTYDSNQINFDDGGQKV